MKKAVHLTCVPKLFSVASEEWLSLKKQALAERSYVIEKANLKHLVPEFGPVLITDIEGKEPIPAAGQ